MHIVKTRLPGVKLLRPPRFDDERGSFSEVFHQAKLVDAGIRGPFVQDNQSFSSKKHTVRGLHFQLPPFAQGKLVRVVRGAILDIAVDLRRGSETFGEHVAMELSAEDGLQAFIPPGYAHGFCTLSVDTLVLYKTTAYYAPEHEGGIHWADKDLGIRWPVLAGGAVLSSKDQKLPAFADVIDQLPQDWAQRGEYEKDNRNGRSGLYRLGADSTSGCSKVLRRS